MAVHIDGFFENSLKDKIKNSKILVVGAGGIGCELLKNLVLTGFEELEVIDLDTIELSNLNRQFLFHKKHIGRPKAIVARESVLKFNPKANITAHHESIFSNKYSVEFFQQFKAVANALDNVAARSHVNRMCLAADIPLVESGSAGYLGNVTVYKKKVTECYECVPRKPQKTYAGCTIRNTPSEPVHCVVWAKHLFNQLFGESDADEEVSPDVADPELGDTVRNDGNVERISTREWAVSVNYDPHKIFNKLFKEDIEYLNKMKDLWQKRQAPTPLDINELPDAVPGSSKESDQDLLKDLIVWSIKECSDVFISSIDVLRKRLQKSEDKILSWDKDDDSAMDFVAACSNLRSHCFSIKQLCRFDSKAIAGNIIPAIATTNAVVSGLLVMQLINIVKGDLSKCRSAWLNISAETTNKFISSCETAKPNPNCFVCASTIPEVIVKLNLETMTVKTLEEKVLKDRLHMVQPDAMLNDGTGTILISSDPEDAEEEMKKKPLSDFNIKSESRLLCEDFFQQYKVLLIIRDVVVLKDQEFEVDIDVDELKKAQEESSEKETQTEAAEPNNAIEVSEVLSDLEDMDPNENEPPKKRKAAEDENSELPSPKKVKTTS